MSGSVNKCIIVGNCTRDPEVRHTQDGKPIVNLSIATNESWRDKATGEKKEKAEFHRVVIFNEGLAKVAEQYVKKGSLIHVEGQLQTRKWTDKDGIEKYSTEIVLQNYRGELTLLGGKSDGDTQARQDDDYQRPLESNDRPPIQGLSAQRFARDLDDEVPFEFQWK